MACLSLTACNSTKSSGPRNGPNAAGHYTTVDPATSATVRGTISFTGNPPKPLPIDMGTDPGCAQAGSAPNLSTPYLVNDGRLANVYVYVKAGLEGKNFAPQTSPVVLEQKGCRYIPHVLGIMVDQPLRIVNDDPTMHNIHAMPRVEGNRQWNLSQAPNGAPLEKSFGQPEIMMPVQCNQHPWMKAYLNVSRTPFFAVSDASGNFEIRGLPPGDYTIAAVHEKAGEQTQPITAGPKETKTLNFSFSAPDGK